MSEKECRFCLDGYETKSNRLISPCLCRGTQKYVHEACLHQWRHLNRESRHYTNCNECNIEYVLSTKYPMETCIMNLTWKYMTLKLFFYYLTTASYYEIIGDDHVEESYSLASFCSSTTSMGIFFFYALKQISRKKLYFKLAMLPILNTLFIIFHYQYNRFFFENNTSNKHFTFYMSLLDILPIIGLLNTHNTILHIMNNVENHEVTENYLLDLHLV